MKKQLMTTTALVAAGLLATVGVAQAQKPKMQVGGWFEGGIGAADNDASVGSRVAADVFVDSELHFKGTVKLDNGIKVRTRVELEAQSGRGAASGNNNSNDLIDEAYMAISGKFGEIRIGSEDNVAHLMATKRQGSWATNVGQNLAFDVADWVETPSGHKAGLINRTDLGERDSEKISYFTPRVSGLRLGATYMPSLGDEGGNSSPAKRDDFNHEGWAVAGDYSHKFGNVGWGIAAGYATAQPKAGGGDQSDPVGWAVGTTLDYGNFRVAAGWAVERNLSTNTSGTDVGSTAYDAGIRYKMGKNHFSLGYEHVEAEASRAITKNDTSDAVLASYRRVLGPGVHYRLNFMYADYNGENPGKADDNSGVAVTTSVRLAF